MSESEGPLTRGHDLWGGSSTGFLSHYTLCHPWDLNSFPVRSSCSPHELSLPVSYIRNEKEQESNHPQPQI